MQVFKNNPLVDIVMTNNIFSYLRNRNQWDVYIDFDLFFSEYNIICDAILSPKYKMIISKRDDMYYEKKGLKNYDYVIPSLADKGIHFSRVLELTPFLPFINRDNIKYHVPMDTQLIKNFDDFWHKNKIRVLLNSSGGQISVSYDFFKEFINILNSKFADKVDLAILNNEMNKKFTCLPGIRETDKLNILQYFAIAASSDIIVTPDTSLVHISGAYDKYCISFYANKKDNSVFLPLNPKKQKYFISADRNRKKDLNAFDVDTIIKCIEQFIIDIEQQKVST
jgi:ADP-heptose:LPS heptosyltransferase